MDLPDTLIILSYWLFVFLLILGILAFCAYFIGAVRRNFRTARVIWIAICVVHLIAILALEQHYPSIAGSPDEPHIAEQFQWLSIFPMLVYCFPSSIFSFALGVGVDNLLCRIVSARACDSEFAFVAIWWLLPVTLGYLQWFAFVPWFLKRSEKRLPALMTGDSIS